MDHNLFMGEAYKEAIKAYDKGEVPVGAVVVYKGKVIGRGHNKRETTNNPLAHGEIEAILQASSYLNSWRLLGTSLYVTLEPCIMCTGAIINSRIGQVYIGTRDYKRGCCGTVENLIASDVSNHRADISFGIMGRESKELLVRFFRELREMRK